MTAIPFRQPQLQPQLHQRLTHPSLPGIAVEFMLITPEYAAELLEHNTSNRPPRPRVIASYSRDMASGNFPFNGDAIRRAADGRLLDGQHRLRAIIDSGIDQMMLVVTGLPAETQATMDAGILRAFADQLKLAGEQNYHLVSALSRKVALWENGCYTFESNLKLTHTELAAQLDTHPELRASASFASKHRVTGLGPSVLAMSHWLLSQVNLEQTEWFLARVHDGVSLPAGHPALLVTKRLRDNLSKRIRLSDAEQLALVITAWNAYRDGRTGQTHLKVPMNLSSANFPVPR